PAQSALVRGLAGHRRGRRRRRGSLESRVPRRDRAPGRGAPLGSPRGAAGRRCAHAHPGRGHAPRRGGPPRERAAPRRGRAPGAGARRDAPCVPGDDDPRLPGLAMLQVYIGYDARETVAFYTPAHSILRHSSIPVSITAVMKSQLKDLFTRPRGPTESTEFALTRFLVPALSRYEGWSLFMDCDMLCRADIAGLARETERHADKA